MEIYIHKTPGKMYYYLHCKRLSYSFDFMYCDSYNGNFPLRMRLDGPSAVELGIISNDEAEAAYVNVESQEELDELSNIMINSRRGLLGRHHQKTQSLERTESTW